jgi:hypothetical protein
MSALRNNGRWAAHPSRIWLSQLGLAAHPLIFYPRYLVEIVSKAWGYWSIYRQHKKILKECLEAPDRWSYSDLAITPPCEKELDSLDLYKATRGGDAAVAKKRKEDDVRAALRLSV